MAEKVNKSSHEETAKRRTKPQRPNAEDWLAARIAAVALGQGVAPSIRGGVARMPSRMAPETAAVVRAANVGPFSPGGVGNYLALRSDYSPPQIKGFRTTAAKLSSGPLVGRIARHSATHDHQVSSSELRRLARRVR